MVALLHVSHEAAVIREHSETHATQEHAMCIPDVRLKVTFIRAAFPTDLTLPRLLTRVDQSGKNIKTSDCFCF